MKLKNKILSALTTLLLSCQYSPAYAQIVDNSLNPVGVELTLCESIAEFAEDVSILRQNGAKYSDVIGHGRYSIEPLFKYVELTANENKRGAISKRVTELYSN